MTANWLYWSLLIGLLGTAVWRDIVVRRIPNWLVLSGIVVALFFNIFAPEQSSPLLSKGRELSVANALLGTLIGFVVLLPLYMLRAMGAGDVKLMAAVGAFLGPAQIAGAALLTFIAGGVFSIVAALFSRSLPRVLTNLRVMGLVAVSGRASGMSLRDVQTTGRLPYAIAIATGTALQIWLAARGGWPFV